MLLLYSLWIWPPRRLYSMKSNGMVCLVAAISLLTTGCPFVPDDAINEGVDFLQRLPVPESGRIVEDAGQNVIRHLGWYDGPFADATVLDSACRLPLAKR